MQEKMSKIILIQNLEKYEKQLFFFNESSRFVKHKKNFSWQLPEKYSDSVIWSVIKKFREEELLRKCQGKEGKEILRKCQRKKRGNIRKYYEQREEKLPENIKKRERKRNTRHIREKKE